MDTTTVYKDGKTQTIKNQYLRGFENSGWTTSNNSGGGTTAPTPPAPAVDPTRVARTANKNDTEINRLTKELEAGSAPSLSKITADKRRGAQAVIDAVTSQFSKTLSDQGVVNAGMNDRVRALNVNSGLGGSDFGTAAAVGQEQKNAQAIGMIEQERDAKINEILAGVDQRASEEYRIQREEYNKKIEGDLDRRKQAKEEDRARATETIKGLASNGVSIESLKTTDPKNYEVLLSEYGGSQLDLETAWNASLPKEQQVQYGQVTKKGANGNALIIRYGLNPVTGKTEKKEYDLGIKYSDFAEKGEPEIKELDGRLYSIETDENGNIKANALTGMSELVRSQINKNNADAKNTVDNKAINFKFSGTQKTKLVNANFVDSDIEGIQADINKYGLQKVLENLPSDEDRKALSDSLKGSDLASQLIEYAQNND